MHPNRLRAPSADGAILASPPFDGLSSVIRSNASRLAPWDHDFQGRRANRLRQMARSQTLALARAFHEKFGLPIPDAPERGCPFVVTGHQPELFHPGVWVKNFAISGMTRRPGSAALNLIIDTDIPKGSSIKVPHRDGDRLRGVPVDYDARTDEAPFEDRPVRDEDLFTSFADRVAATFVRGTGGTLLPEFWRRVLDRRDRGIATDRVGLRFALARHETEWSWGLRNWEVPIGAVCETEAFLWFACHILAHLHRFQSIHNAALARYRAAYGIRSRNHPVPALGRQGEWLEAPFWIWRVQSPRRRPLLVRPLGKTMQLRIGGEDEPFAEIPLGSDREACCAVEALEALPAQGIRLRTRALTTTMFARYLLGDLFVHGIGGAKYDELGDEVAREFLDFEPPTFLTLSQTIRLGLDNQPATEEGRLAVEREIRDLEYNPERYLPDPRPADARPFVESKWVAIEGPVASHRDRVGRLRTIRSNNAALAGWVESRRENLEAERDRIEQGLKENAVANSREYAFPLHDEARLRAALEATREQAGAAGPA